MTASGLIGANPERYHQAGARNQPGRGPGGSGLRLQVGVVVADERADVVGHVEQLRPLLLVEGHREASEAVDRDAALLADLQRDALRGRALQALVLRAQLLELGLDLVFRHEGSHSKWIPGQTRAGRTLVAARSHGAPFAVLLGAADVWYSPGPPMRPNP